MNIKLFIFLATNLLSINLIAMDRPNLKDVFTISIYDLQDVNEKTSVDEIKAKLLEAKSICVKTKKTSLWEKRLGEDRAHNFNRQCVKYVCYGTTCLATVATTWFFWPAGASWAIVARTVAVPTIKTAFNGIVLSEIIPNLLMTPEIEHKELDKLESQITYWKNGAANESIFACECEYLTKKYNEFIPKDVQHQIELVLIESRDTSIRFNAEDFVREALRFPIECKQLTPKACPAVFSSLNGDKQESLRKIMADIARCSIVACRPHEADARMRHIHVFVGGIENTDAVREIAKAYQLSFHEFMPITASVIDMYGCNRDTENSTKGELIKIFCKNDENFHNAVLKIDFDYLCDLTEKPSIPIRQIIKADSFHNNYFDVDIDLRKLHVFIYTSGKDDERTHRLLALAGDLDVEVLDFRD